MNNADWDLNLRVEDALMWAFDHKALPDWVNDPKCTLEIIHKLRTKGYSVITQFMPHAVYVAVTECSTGMLLVEASNYDNHWGKCVCDAALAVTEHIKNKAIAP